MEAVSVNKISVQMKKPLVSMVVLVSHKQIPSHVNVPQVTINIETFYAR